MVYLLEGVADIIAVHAFANAFPSTTPGGLQHDWVANLFTALQSLLHSVYAGLQDEPNPA